ncbi:energy-coupling factor transporter ATPase [Heliophilum fasciatum]|uniref:Energy-coupling factor transport system ATP-binding protein n=1 Tax=Heliophilum fasciatum TaxID=35700 RepID=A0A4R2RLC1_9FIRM|nr:energy-coupling factor transporter ATPase [Heliophilum fasciatum]MCW2277786.1 energy-coupling factor transporter ATPase [Heliophilum fasciatum]TCP64720.1 energy-coupling factor transport system ATP-binding protein [Heliophilum fasciatum]
MLLVEELSYAYRTQEGANCPALMNVSLQIQPGERVAIVGANGSGKSTLVKHLNGLIVPQKGKVMVDGYCTSDPQQRAQVRRTVGMVFQNPDNQIVAPTVEDDVAFGPENLGLPVDMIKQRVHTALQAVDLLGARLRPVHALSGGQKQRLAIAGALAMEPRYLILDEATSMVDPEGKKEILQVLRQLQARKIMALIQITHDMQEAAEAERIIVMGQQHVLSETTPERLFQQPQLLQQAGLTQPPVISLADRLRRRNVPVPETVQTMKELVDCLCQLRSVN